MTTLTGFDLGALRAEFPMLAHSSRGRRLAYLDRAATAQRPAAVIAAMDDYHRNYNANINRGVYQASEQATLAYQEARESVARFLGNVDANEVVFVRGTTEAINLVANSWLRPRLDDGDVVLVTEMEHHANIVPWQLVGATTMAIPILDNGELDLAAAEALLATAPRLLAVTHVSNALGTVNPIAELCGMAARHGVPVLVDGAQAVPHLPVDVQSLGADFYCFSGHKLFGPTGTGVLWARSEHLAVMPPWQGGGDMIDTVSFEASSFAPPPRRFEAGTPHIAGAIGLAAAIEWLASHDRDAWATHEQSLLQRMRAGLDRIGRVQRVATGPDNIGIVTFNVDGIHPHDVASLLDQDGVCVRAGHHCTQPLHRRLGLQATVRASLAPYNSVDDVDALVQSLERAIGVFG